MGSLFVKFHDNRCKRKQVRASRVLIETFESYSFSNL